MFGLESVGFEEFDSHREFLNLLLNLQKSLSEVRSFLGIRSFLQCLNGFK